MFPLKWRSKLVKQGARITSVDELRQKLKPECRLDTLSLAAWADDLVALLINAIKTTLIEPLVQQNTRPVPAINHPQFDHPRATRTNHICFTGDRLRTTITLPNAIMHQAMTEYAAMLAASSSEAQGPSERIPSKEEWYQQTPKRFLFPELVDIPQLIPSTPKREIGVGTTYLISPMRPLQKAMIDNTKTVDAMLSAIELKEEEEQIVPVEARTPFIELSNNLRQLPRPLAFLDHPDIQQEDDPKNLHLSNEENLEGRTHDSGNCTHNSGNRIHELANRTHDSANRTHDLGDRTHNSGNRIHESANRTHDLRDRTHDLGDRTHDLANCIRNSENRISDSDGRQEVIRTQAAKHVENANASKQARKQQLVTTT